ncbi:KDP operon transcriptional regulatory protein KdpE [Roseovarius albus]|uniref:KDP operon transcriptional regulatory protein KdpE n=1 Tax=Roseovarius albus TaxID=1247867 RepID=A0A1X7A2R9_9RHOB|nr:response regulator [Roseovarius albus]SLN68621.1 KDP operon transcriptional regulatory protein KdpE [Roseovarius albus]
MEDLILKRNPTRKHPLLGLTVLVVEDSKFASDAMRLMCLRSGARIRRADCLCSARKHLKVYRPSVVIIDVGLPDGSGLELIKDLHAARPRVNVLLGMSGDDAQQEATTNAGADGFVAKPLVNLAYFQTTILSHLDSSAQVTGLQEVGSQSIEPDQIAYQDDMSHAATLLEAQQDDTSLEYVTQFLRSVATSAGDMRLEKAAKNLSRATSQGYVPRSIVREVLGMLQHRMDQTAAF